jgi:hypothetical protein
MPARSAFWRLSGVYRLPGSVASNSKQDSKQDCKQDCKQDSNSGKTVLLATGGAPAGAGREAAGEERRHHCKPLGARLRFRLRRFHGARVGGLRGRCRLRACPTQGEFDQIPRRRHHE